MSSGLTYRERFERTLSHVSVDRVPMDLGATDMTGIEGGPRRVALALGMASELTEDDLDEAALQALDIDIRGVGGVLEPTDTQAHRISDTEFVDAWGIGYRWTGHHYEAVGRPLAGAGLRDLETFPWPDPDKIDLDTIRQIAERARYLFEETPYVVCGRHPCFGVMELGCWMCGFDDFLYRMAAEPDFVHRFFEILLSYQKRVTAVYYGALGRYLHFTTSGDDFGTQTGPFLSPRMFRELVFPYLSERIGYLRRFTDAPFFHHTCGSVYSLIPDLVRAGVEILNPIQPRVTDMEPGRLKREFGATLTFYGGVDTQDLLPNGSEEQVYEATRDLISILGDGGGYILSAAHVLQSEVPVGNILAMYRAGGQRV